MRAVRSLAVAVALVIAASPAAAGRGAKAKSGTNGRAQSVTGVVKQGVGYGRQVKGARARFQSADHRPVRRALASFGDTAMAPAERRRLLSEASGEPLTDSALAIARGLAAFVPRGAFAMAGRASRRQMGGAKRAVKTYWFGKFVPQDLSETGRALDSLAAAVEKPEFRGQLDTALNVLRVAGRIEAENLARLSGRLPEENVPAVKEALSRYAADLAGDVVAATGGGAMSAESRAATSRLVTGLIDVARMFEATAGQPTAARDQAIARAVRTLQGDLRVVSVDARRAGKRVARRKSLEAVDWKRLNQRLAVRQRRLNRRLSKLVDMDPDARAAADALARDVALAGKFALGTARIIGAASNSDMKPRERAAVVKEAAESMGPIFIKMVQTIINKTGALEEFGLGKNPEDAVVLVALSDLQDKVTPMPERILREQVRKSLGGKEIEEAFAEFDMKPVKSASIAQVHHARVWVRRPPFFKKRLIEVAVKVQRPNLDADMKEAVHAARLSMAIARESLRAFDIAGSKKIDPAKFARSLDLVDGMLTDFMSSFAIETDFARERTNMRRMARLVRNEKDVFVPRVYEDYSGELVITMDYIRGDKLSEPPKPPLPGEEPEPEEVTYMSRAARAQRARDAGPPRRGPLPGAAGAAETEARARAADHAVRTWGLDPTEVVVTRRRDGGFDATARFDHDAQPVAHFLVRADGRIANRSTAPDLSRVGVAELRDRMLGSFVGEAILNRFLHGDIHRGNFRILADGKTIALLDFGQMVELRPTNITAAALFGVGLLRRDPGRIASAVVRMSDQYGRMNRSQRRAAIKEVKAAFEMVFAKDQPLSADLISTALVRATGQADLTLSSVYPQLLKTSWAMWGNLADTERQGEPLGPRSAKRVVGRLGTQLVSKPLPVAVAIDILKRRRVERILRESAAPRAD